MNHSGLLLALSLLAAVSTGVGAFDLAATLRDVMEPEQARAFTTEDPPEALVRALTPVQRQAAGAKLHEAEARATDPRALREIHRGYLALREAESAWRVGDGLVERFPQSSLGYTLRGQAAESSGDYAEAAAQAREALERDPSDVAAHALLKLTEGRISAPSAREHSAAPQGDLTAPESGASAEAMSLMHRALQARHDRDMPRVLALAQAAMNADPKSAAAQEFYAAVQKDLRRQKADRVGFYAALQRRDAYERAQREVAAELEAARRAAQGRRMPPLHPLSGGAVLLTLGVMLWERRLRDEAREQVKQLAAGTAIVVGCAGIAYGASSLLLSSGARAAPPAARLVTDVGRLGEAAVLEPAAAATAGVLGAGALMQAKTEHYSFASPSAPPSDSSSNKKDSANPNAKDNLNRKLRALEDAQRDAVEVRRLPDGRVRYYDAEKPARKIGPTRGARFVTEFDPKSGQVRQWMESYDHGGNVVRVHPKTINGQVVDSTHFPPIGKELAP